ncbi:MAG: glucose-1-phosphate adenylyltransferase [Gammaproteobacteria bacterium]|nr:glucose-1-phosphate adenylyltransferase [Gammaproteobacteria bacterium]MBT8134420.1 glucose-1-phosphate adenylyltransferase [Gammaproteobacteria bacterium]NNJ49793.1 glucose-1-phosphate adenylyltransferase [Gammaproteobacteria bacterium]
MSNTTKTQSKNYRYYTDANTGSELTRKTLVLVLAGGSGSRLKGLTKWRAKPAVPFGGKYRIIDFALSNCVNSGLRRIGVLTQYKSHSLIRHLQRAWGFMRAEIGEFVEVIPAQQRVDSEWYRGTADALYQNIDIIRRHEPENVIVLGGDHIYTMDYSKMLYQHVSTGSDLTVGCIEVPREEATEFGVMSIDTDYRITKFTEKPADPDTIPGKADKSLASMGIYIFSTAYLYASLIADAEDKESAHDFGKDIVPKSISTCTAHAYPFEDADGNAAYWRDVGTIDSYWKANIELCDVEPELNLYSRDWPIWTYQTQHPPAKFIFDDENVRGQAIDSLVSGGCILSGARVKRSVIFFATEIERGTAIKDSVILPKVSIGKNCRINRAIIDKACRIEDGTIIGEDIEEDRKRFHVTESGIVLVTPEMLDQHLYVVDKEMLKESA